MSHPEYGRTDLVPLPSRGRRFTASTPVRLGDTDPAGRLRLDATARLLQDVANDDALDAGLDNAIGWLVRRTLIDVRQPAVLAERLTLTTFCGGIGRSWAERRTSVTGDQGASIEAACLWVQIDVERGRPAALSDTFHERYAEAAQGRTVTSRLTLPPPGPDVERRPWSVRAADLDVFGHVNNAVAWSVLEEHLAIAPDRAGRGEVEYPGPLDRAPAELLSTPADAAGAHSAWVVAGDAVRVAARWTPTG